MNEIADVLETIRDVVNIASSRIQEEKRGAVHASRYNGTDRRPVPSERDNVGGCTVFKQEDLLYC